MVAETSSGMSRRLTLDHPSFEKLLAAAWVLQCLHDQLHNQEVVRSENIAQLVETPEPPQTENSVLPVAVQTVAHPSPGVTLTETTPEALSVRPVGEKILAETVVPPPSGIPILKSEVAVKAEPGTVKPETTELKKSLRSKNVLSVRSSKPHLPLLARLADQHRKQWARLRPAFNLRTANLHAAILRTANLRIINLRSALSRARDAFAKLRPAFRVNLTLPALRAAAIVAPVLTLAIVAALLLFDTSHHQALYSAQANSVPGAPAAGTIVSEPSTTTTTATRGTFDNHKRIPDRKPNQLAATPLPLSSHREVTDPATLSAVHGLSKYEIKSLRRQAKYGDASAAFTLGMAYEMGRHVSQNCAEATRWVTTAAEEGNAAAEYNLGLRYRDGDGVPANRAESEKWLRRAAARRYPKANLALKMLASR
jgi:hypothetical protein